MAAPKGRKEQKMTQIDLTIDGMACSMCENHICDAIRRAVPVKKVTAFHKTGQAVALTEQPIDLTALKAAVEATGYRVTAISSRPYEKKGLFSHFF